MSVFNSVRDSVSMVDVAQMLNLDVRRGYIPCPYHKERTPSCKLYDTHFYCYSCHEHGDAVKLTADILGLSPIDAVKYINQYFSLGLELGGAQQLKKKKSRAVSEVSSPKELQVLWLEVLASVCRLEFRFHGDTKDLCDAEELHQTFLMATPDEFIAIFSRKRKEVAHFGKKFGSLIQEHIAELDGRDS